MNALKIILGTVIITVLLCGCSMFNNSGKAKQKSELLKSSSFFPLKADWGRGELKQLPKYNPEGSNSFGVDLRSYNLSKLNLKEDYTSLSHSDFNEQTIWPKTLPKHFNPEKVMETGVNPGLGIRKLHEEGITGKGVGIAIIDQRLLRNHQEYAKQIRLYKEFGYENVLNQDSSMHGPAVASIAVGKTCGVAPDADLYFFAANNVKMITKTKYETFYNNYTKAIQYILELNKILPENKKIRVISISWGYNPKAKTKRKGIDEYVKAINKAKNEGVLVVTTRLEYAFHYGIDGLGRNETSNPDKTDSYLPGLFWRNTLYNGKWISGNDVICVPMDCRTTASPLGDNEYVFYSNGGMSWSVPWLAGMYLLACQVDPQVTPEQFLKLAYDTGTPAIFKHDGKVLPKCGNIINPDKIIKTLVGK